MTRRRYIPWIILAVSLLLTLAATWIVADGARARDEERFENAVQSTRDRIEARLETYVALLRGGTGLFAASDTPVTHEDFREYTSRLHIQQRYPGIQGIGFSRRIIPAGQDSLVAAMRAQGFSEFHVWPDTTDVEPHAILYLEPLDLRNQAAIGYNMFSDSTRRTAMVRARDTGTAAMTGRVTLVQEIEGRVQAGFLIYVPVYESDAIPDTTAERQAGLEGFVYAPFRADDLFAGILGTEEQPRVAFRIYDGLQIEPENLLHDSRTSGIMPAEDADFTATTRLDFGGRTWTITFAATPFFVAGSRFIIVPFLAAGGLLLSLVLFGLSRAQVAAEEDARESEQRLRSILESLPVGVFVADRSGHVTFSNRAGRRIWLGGNHSGAEANGANRGWWTDTDRPIKYHEQSIARALGGENVEGEVSDIEAADGTPKTILTSAFPVRNRAGAIQMAISAVVDISEQKRAEVALRDQEQELRTMVDSVPQLAWMAGTEGGIFWYNQRWYDYTGSTLEEMQGWGWQTVQHPEHRDRVVAGFKEAIRAGTPWEDTFPLRRKDGVYRWFLSRAVPIRDSGGRVVRWFGTNTDITKQREAREAETRALREQAAREAAEVREEHLRLRAAELERSNRELQDFAYVASHDLQEPLRKISSFADLIRIEYGERLDEEGVHYLTRMEQAAIRMSNLIRDLLTFSRVTTKASPPERVDLNAIVTDVLSDLEVRIKETDAQVHVGTMPAIEADPLQMRQLFQNLIGNALKFQRPGVAPVVRVSGTRESAGSIGSPGKRDVCRIEVEDNGIGFDVKYLDRIFAPFQRLHTTEEYAGTGIGLAICRRIVERHGGTISARSTPGSGSAFTIILPVKQPQSVVTE